MVLGTAGELPKPPAEKITFLEDMTDSQLADAVSGLTYTSRRGWPGYSPSTSISSGCPLD